MVHFNRLRLTGFKSFVDPTELEIGPGTTGIVGPNGCGKSNLVEALRWVMGETSAKQMRGAGMEDVIFSGTSDRPSRNIAEVALQIDNNSRQAPAAFNDFTEMDVIRRIERDKGSQYKVNGQEVRAADVKLLFADMATGAKSTAIVSQGRVGAIINSKPSDRRTLLEEAAGITGLHSRRHEAELRLKAAETNLERLDDVIGTLEVQLQALKKQARQANRYRNIAEHLRREEAMLFLIDSEKAKEFRKRAGEALSEAERVVAGHSEKAAAAATKQAEAAAVLPGLRQREAEASAALQRLILERDGLDREAQRVSQAAQAAQDRLKQLESDVERARSLAGDAGAAIERLEQEQKALQVEQKGEAEQQVQAQAAKDAALTQVSERQEEVDALAQSLAEAEASQRAMQRRQEELAQRLSSLKGQRQRQEDERQAIEAQLAAESGLSEAEARLAACEADLAGKKEAAEQGEGQVETLREEEAVARETLQTARSNFEKLSAEVAALSAILDRADEGQWPGLVEEVKVSAGYEAALGAALGEDISLPINSNAPQFWSELPDYSQKQALPAGVGSLADQVLGPKALTRRLSQIGVVTSLAEGERLQADLLPGQRLVTQQGDLWRWDGLVAKADAPSSAAQRLAQKNRLEELRKELPLLEAAKGQAQSAFEAAQARCQEQEQADKQARDSLRLAYAALEEARAERTRLSEAAAALVNRKAALEQALEQLDAFLAEAQAEQAALEQSAEQAQDLESERQALQSKRLSLAEARDDLTQADSALQQALREAQARATRLLDIQREQQTWRKRIGESEGYLDDLSERREAIEQEIAELAELPGKIESKKIALGDQVEEAEGKRKAAADALAEAEKHQSDCDRGLREAEQHLSEAREARVRAEASVEQADQAIDNLVLRIEDKLDCTIADLPELAGRKPDETLPDRAQVEAKVERLQRERENLGAVNLRAEAEAEEMEQQIEGMTNERDDLVQAIAKLRQGISQLNREARERLTKAFLAVDEKFQRLFKRLFGGGEAHLRMTDEEDPLAAGLEIMASPPGKKLQILSLLSGGEQALTALALLFAVFLTNPAPICILDEVDAPLDDSNVDRFCTLVEELGKSLDTRFLIITHHRLTMARMDRLFGVTMAERGVSRLVSVDLEGAVKIRDSA